MEHHDHDCCLAHDIRTMLDMTLSRPQSLRSMCASAAASAANRIKTSRFGFPAALLAEVCASSGYSPSVRNLAGIGYAADNVFSDGTALQIASVSGSLGHVATLTVGVSL